MPQIQLLFTNELVHVGYNYISGGNNRRRLHGGKRGTREKWRQTYH